jgi:hypothetical protein
MHVEERILDAQATSWACESRHVPSRKRVGVDLRKAEELLALDGTRVVLK